MPNCFYFDPNGQKQGPIDNEQLQELVSQGIITPETSLETETGHKEVAGQIPDLIFPETTPPTVSEPSDDPNPFAAAISQVKVVAQYTKALYDKIPEGRPRLAVIAGASLLVLFCGLWWMSSSPRFTAEEQAGTEVHENIADDVKPADAEFTAEEQANIDKFIEKYGTDAKAKDNMGMTPLHRAAENKNVEVAKFLVFKGADVKAKANGGFTPLHWAARYNS